MHFSKLLKCKTYLQRHVREYENTNTFEGGGRGVDESTNRGHELFFIKEAYCLSRINLP